MANLSSFTLKVKSYKEMESPFSKGKSSSIRRHVMFANIEGFDSSLKNWFKTNPRFQNTATKVSRDIKDSLKFKNEIFHNLNKGLLFSAKNLTFYKDGNLGEGEIHFLFEKPEIHGNIDGGHTLQIINDYKEALGKIKETYVFVEIITGINNPQDIVEIAAARNSSVKVTLASIADLEGKFASLKELLERKKISFRNRIIYKMNENKLTKSFSDNPNFEKKDINIRDIISILSMFNLDLYSNKLEVNVHPTKCYSAREKALQDFMNLDKNSAWKNRHTKHIAHPSKNISESVSKMELIFEDIFKLYDVIEKEFPKAYNSNNKKYGAIKSGDKSKDRKSKFTQIDLSNVLEVPEGIIFPLLGAFRALIIYNELRDKLEWKINPFEVWEKHKKPLAGMVANFIEENKEWERRLGAKKIFWQNLFMYVSALNNSYPSKSKENSLVLTF